MRQIDWLVVHTAAADIPGVNAQKIRQWHHERGWRDIGYHFVICDDGTLELGRPVDQVGAHAKGLNTNSIGVCVTGHGDKYDFNEAQYDTLVKLLIELCYEHDLDASDVIGHREIHEKAGAPSPWKSCPGNKVDMDQIRLWVELGLDPKDPRVPKDPPRPVGFEAAGDKG